jgi:hypothetical protein
MQRVPDFDITISAVMHYRDFFGLIVSIDLSSTAVITSPEMCIESQLCGLSETNPCVLELSQKLIFAGICNWGLFWTFVEHFCNFSL